MLGWLLVWGCVETTPSVAAPPPRPDAAAPATPSPSSSPRLRFIGVTPSSDPATWDQTVTASRYVLDGVEHDLRWQPLAVGGERYGDTVLGALTDARGAPMLQDGAPLGCRDLDFAALLRGHGRWFLAQHVECIPGALYLSSVAVDGAGGLSLSATRPVDLAGIGGVINPCAGDVTPWGSWLSSEEYEQDVREVRPDGSLVVDRWGFGNMAAYRGVAPADVDPYTYGWLPEVTVTDADGGTTVARRYALGRFSHELGRVLPDRKTVILSDDGSGVGLFLFVADVADDLSAGTLYASVWQQQGEGAVLSWVSLGHAREADVAAALTSRRVRFEDLFQAAAPTASGCPEGLTEIRALGQRECLAVIPGQELLASRLETRRFAALRGATVELSKGEGLAVDAARQTIYFATSVVGGPMGDKAAPVLGEHLRLPENPCGVVWSLRAGAAVRDTDGQLIPSTWVPEVADVVVRGVPDGGGCQLDAIANPDNLAYVPEADLLLVAEDTRNHDLPALWGVVMGTGEHVRLLLTPFRGEVTGLNWFPDVDGRGYITVTVQHPLEPSKMPARIPAGLRVPSTPPPSVTGVLGPIDLGR